MNHRSPLALALLVCTLPIAAPLAAHDFWLEPRPRIAAPGDRIAVSARVGEGFSGEAIARSDAHVERFVVVDGQGERPVAGLAGRDPAGWFTVRSPGLQLVAYDSHHSTIELASARFESYLAEEGLERIVALRAERGESGAAGSESFSRCAKTMLDAGGDRAGFDRLLGLELELVPVADPFALEPGDGLPVLLLFRGSPLAGVRVTAIPREEPGAAVSGRTDAAGRVELPIGLPGDWLLKAVHMEEASPGLETDWESWWASLTFTLTAE